MKAWFLCSTCGHERHQRLDNAHKGNGCKYCTRTAISPPCRECEWCYESSFASNPMAVQWHPTKNGDKRPEDYWATSSKKVWLLYRGSFLCHRFTSHSRYPPIITSRQTCSCSNLCASFNFPNSEHMQGCSGKVGAPMGNCGGWGQNAWKETSSARRGT